MPGYEGSPFTAPASSFSQSSLSAGKLSRSKVLQPALLAVVLAWGAKFAEHPILALDRQANGGRSRIAHTLVHKACEVADAEKVPRFATADNAIVALLLEPLQNCTSSSCVPRFMPADTVIPVNTSDPDGERVCTSVESTADSPKVSTASGLTLPFATSPICTYVLYQHALPLQPRSSFLRVSDQQPSHRPLNS